MPSQFKDSLIEAMRVMAEDTTKITYECSVVKCLDGVTGEYELNYMSNKITAFALDVSKKYSPNDLVMVIAPKGDFNDIKYILNLVNPIPSGDGGGEGGGEPEKQENTFVPLTDDLLDKDNPAVDIFGLNSYFSTDYGGNKEYYEEDITSKVCDITRFKERIIKYINGKELSYFRLKITIQTKLSQEQIYSNGEYGIKLYIPYIDKGYMEYKFSSNQMEGNPKDFKTWTLQSTDIRVDQGYVYNESMPPIVKIYKDKFILDEAKVQEPDILIKNVELYILSMLTPEDLKGYKVFIAATEGEYFIKSDSINDTKTLTATLKSNGVDTDISNDEMYWFVEDPTIDKDDPEYFEISGAGWKCLNPYTIEQVKDDKGETIDKVVFVPRVESIEVIAKDIQGNKKYKCLIKHNENYFSGETTIYNETDTFYLKLIPTEGEVVSPYEDEVELKLRFYYKGLTDEFDNSEKLCYTWSKIEKDGKEDFYFTRKYLRIISKNEVIVEKNKHYWVTTVAFPASIINEIATIRCSLELEGPILGLEEFKDTKKYFIGTAETKLELTSEIVDPYFEDMRKAIPKVLYSYNANTIAVQQDGVVIASIACKLQRKTDLQGHLVVNLIASEYSNAVVRFLDNEMTELFAPVTFTLQPGRNTIGVPHDYLYRLAGIHSFIVTMQCTNGIVTIPVRGVLFSIKGGYLVERMIDIGMDVQDLSIKQSIGIDFDDTFVPYEPEEIWTVGLDNGNILVKSCSYNRDEVLEWTPRYEMGKGRTAAIEFDGKWYLREEDETYTLITEKEPYIFVVELDGTLVVYKGGNKETRKVLDTNVTQISVVRGYKSEKYKDQDQGLVCAYIKEDGFPYYIQYAYYAVNTEYRWGLPVQLTAIKTLGIYIQRLNDYRIGILLEQEDANMWWITQRTYVAQAIPPETIDLYPYNQLYCCSCIRNSDLDSFVGTEVPFKDNTKATDTFQIRFRWPLVYKGKEPLDKDTFVIKVNNKVVEIRGYKIEDNLLSVYTKEKQDHQPYADSHIELTIKNNYLLQLFYNKSQYHQLEEKIYRYTIVRPINIVTYEKLFSETINLVPLEIINDIKVMPINTLKPQIFEEINLKHNNVLKLNVVPIINTGQKITENIDFTTMNESHILDVVLIGDSPI